MKAVVYSGRHTPEDGGPQQVTVELQVDGRKILHRLRHRELHSPDGFQWGYGGSGPADLALGILLDYLGEDPTERQLYRGDSLAWALHQDFKWAFVAKFGRVWQLTGEEIDAWLATLEVAATVGEFTGLWSRLDEIPERPLEEDADLS